MVETSADNYTIVHSSAPTTLIVQSGSDSYTITSPLRNQTLPPCDHEDREDGPGIVHLGCYWHEYEHPVQVHCRHCTATWDLSPSCGPD